MIDELEEVTAAVNLGNPLQWDVVEMVDPNDLYLGARQFCSFALSLLLTDSSLII